MFSYNIVEQGNDLLLAVCDEEILGKTFSNGEIAVTVSDFYKGNKCGEKEIIKIARSATIINAMGNKVIGLFVEKKLVDLSSVIKIGNVMHAQVVSV